MGFGLRLILLGCFVVGLTLVRVSSINSHVRDPSSTFLQILTGWIFCDDDAMIHSMLCRPGHMSATTRNEAYATEQTASINNRSMSRLFVFLLAWIGIAHSFQAAHVGVSKRTKLVHNLQLHNTGEGTRNNCSSSRRTFLISSGITSSSLLLPFHQKASALPFFQQNRRQLELCLVQVLRTKYWAMNVAKSINTKLLLPPTDVIELLSDAQRRQPYLEARLGAKAILTKKVGGGANSNVEKLASFQLKECLDDGRYWCTELAKNNQLPGQSTGGLKNGKRFCTNELVSISDDIIESLASISEFDGLDGLDQASPRSSLMINMYDSKKGTFVYRTLVERIIPSCDRYLQLFGNDRLNLCLEFVRSEYADEMPIEVLSSLYDDAS